MCRNYYIDSRNYNCFGWPIFQESKNCRGKRTCTRVNRKSCYAFFLSLEISRCPRKTNLHRFLEDQRELTISVKRARKKCWKWSKTSTQFQDGSTIEPQSSCSYLHKSLEICTVDSEDTHETTWNEGLKTFLKPPLLYINFMNTAVREYVLNFKWKLKYGRTSSTFPVNMILLFGRGFLEAIVLRINLKTRRAKFVLPKSDQTWYPKLRTDTTRK